MKNVLYLCAQIGGSYYCRGKSLKRETGAKPVLFPQLSSSLKGLTYTNGHCAASAAWEGGLTEESQETCQSDTDLSYAFG